MPPMHYTLALYTACALLIGGFAGVAFASYRLRGGRSYGANVRRVFGLSTDLGGPGGEQPPPP